MLPNQTQKHHKRLEHTMINLLKVGYPPKSDKKYSIKQLQWWAKVGTKKKRHTFCRVLAKLAFQEFLWRQLRTCSSKLLRFFLVCVTQSFLRRTVICYSSQRTMRYKQTFREVEILHFTIFVRWCLLQKKYFVILCFVFLHVSWRLLYCLRLDGL